MTKNQTITILLALLLTWANQTIALAQSLEGRVMLNDTLPAVNATIFLPEVGIGTITDQDGRYLLVEIPRGTQVVEYSYLGYKPVRRKLVINDGRMAHDEQLQEQPIELATVYMTPNGEDPALYILRKVAEQAQKNRQRMQQYDATMINTVRAKDLDVIETVLPKALKWTLHGLMKMVRMGALFDYCVSAPEVETRLSTRHLYADGKTTYQEDKIVSANPPLTGKAKDQLFRLTHEELFDQLYGTDVSYHPSHFKKGQSHYKLKGTVEEHGKVVDVLEWKRTEPGDSVPQISTLYVVEDEWGILRAEYRSEMWYMLNECRNVGGNIYLPISLVTEPKYDGLDLQKLKREADEEAAKAAAEGKKVSKMERNMAERLEKLLKERQRIKPILTLAYTVRYTNVKVAP